jgi:hypothetical protein
MRTDGLHSVDFAVCSVLFAVLYGISSLSTKSTKEEGGGKYLREEGIRRDALKLSSTTAFLGILISFDLAWIAPWIPEQFSKYMGVAPTVPAALLCLWWYYERRGSASLDFDALADSVNKRYEDAILTTAREMQLVEVPMTPVDEDRLYEASVARASSGGQLLPDSVKRIIPSGTMLISVKALENVVQSFAFSRERFDALLSDLRERKVLSPKPREVESMGPAP